LDSKSNFKGAGQTKNEARFRSYEARIRESKSGRVFLKTCDHALNASCESFDTTVLDEGYRNG